MAEALGDEPSLARVLYWQGRIAYVRGEFADALPLAEQSLAIADRLADEKLSAPPANLLGRICGMRWDVARGSQLMARTPSRCSGSATKSKKRPRQAWPPTPLLCHGEPAQALAYGHRAVALARELANPFAEAAALHLRGIVHDQQAAGRRR